MKTPEESLLLFENMAKNNHQWSNDRLRQRAAGIYEIDMMTSIAGKVDALAKKVDGVGISSPSQYCSVDLSIDFMIQ